jgi:hypothetical protein
MKLCGSQHGVALVAVLVAMTLMMALGAGLVLSSSSETAIAANFRTAAGAFYAADAIMDRALAELAVTVPWTDVPSGTVLSGFVDGGPGSRTLADGQTIDLLQVLNMANCQKPSACATSDLDAVTTERPWGTLNPRWQLYAHGPLSALVGGSDAESPFYVVAMVSDDPTDNDGDVAHDGLSGGFANPGRQVLMVRAEAFGPRASHKVVEATIARIDTVPPTVALRSRREIP